MSKKIYWIESSEKNSLAGRVRVVASGGDKEFTSGLNESDIDPIQKWCEDHNCGRRISFDTFQFKNKKQLTMFLLRWG